MTAPADPAVAGGGLPVSTGRDTWREVWRITRGHRRKLLIISVLGVVSATAGLVFPAAIGILVDRIANDTADLTTILWVLTAMVVAAAAGAVAAAATIVLAARSYHAMLAELRERLLARAMTLPQSLVERVGTGDLISRSSDDVAEVADAAPQIIPALTATGFTIAVTSGGMTVVDPWYGLALIVILPVYVMTVRWYLSTAPAIYAAERTAMSTRAQHLLESQRGFDTIAGFNLGEGRHLRVLEASWGVVGHSLRAQTVQNMFFGRLNLAEYLGLAAILIVGFWQISAGQSSVGAATTAVLLFLRLFGPINQLLFVVDTLQSVAASLNRIVGVILLPDTAEKAATTATDPSRVAGLSGVRFGYEPDRTVLDGIDLTLIAGERVAVVGASGAGKTTLAGVLAGIHHPDAGTVTRPERTAVVTQEVHVFAGTVRENLTLAAPDATDEHLLAALRTTSATALLDLLPHGLDTLVGAAGRELTAAQAQQLALTRLLLAEPELAILDEATAEAGSTDADMLDHAATAATSGRVAVVIAHRLSQAASCDRILVMDTGRIIEEGPHRQLIAAGGVYAKLWAVWSDGRGIGEGKSDVAPRRHEGAVRE